MTFSLASLSRPVLHFSKSSLYAVEGDVHYDYLTVHHARQFRGDVQYCPEDDIHFPTLTVKQSVFGICSQKTQSTSSPIALLQTFLGVNILTRLPIYSTIFGLNHVQDTPIVDAAIRGISVFRIYLFIPFVLPSFFLDATSAELVTRSSITSWDK